MKAITAFAFLSTLAVTLPTHASVTPPNKPAIVKPLAPVASKIDLNKADLSQLTGSYKGIGKKRAQAIIDYRQSHNGFKSIEELAQVKGLGQHFLETHREKLKEIYVIN